MKVLFPPNSSSSKYVFLRRLGPDPHEGGARTIALNGCPDVFELKSGDFAIIGIDILVEKLQIVIRGVAKADAQILYLSRSEIHRRVVPLRKKIAYRGEVRPVRYVGR